MGGWLLNNELQRIPEEAVMTYHLPGETEKIMKTFVGIARLWAKIITSDLINLRKES
jgi:hypothetical protein